MLVNEGMVLYLIDKLESKYNLKERMLAFLEWHLKQNVIFKILASYKLKNS